MSPIVTLAAGANQPLEGQQITIDVHAVNLGGVVVLAEEDGALRALPAADALAPVDLRSETAARVLVDLAALPAGMTRLRVLAWSVARTRVLSPAGAQVAVDGVAVISVPVADAGGTLRSAEILEVYQRHGAWKLRAIASGWEGHVPAMARAVGLPEATFAGAPGGGAGMGPGGRSPSPPGGARGTPESSPLLGPPALRGIADSIVGPGWRDGDGDSLFFEVAGIVVHLMYENRGGIVQLVAIIPMGSGPRTDATAEVALRVTGAAPMSRVALLGDGGAIVTAVVYVQDHQLDSGVVKALLSDAWVTAADFGARARPLGWEVTDRLTPALPRELRLGIGEELQSVEEWRGVRERLLMNDCIPLADEPAALLAVDQEGQLCIGPSLLAGSSRAWAIVVERVLRSDVVARSGVWSALADRNQPISPVRFGVVDEVGVGGPPAITVSYAALQIPRTQVLEDLQRGLEAVDAASNDIHGLLTTLTPDADWQRNNLPWVPTRRWNGPGTELRDAPLVRELSTLPDGTPPPSAYATRVRHQASAVGRPTVAWIAHLALLRAEADPVSDDWKACAKALVGLAPVNGPGEPSATASLHVRLDRLLHPQPVRSGGGAPPSPPPSGAPRSGRRWRIFG
ncbi:hypothetical protein DSM112329_02690 [Paraconexibacter sp. AEG42_29]|uniref:TerD domain-containing protein n=1 Tax=Paraconexibacter sp. AEG42_29 TaxID=2997339 RepID=A0AAU7AWI5_9ACTN